MITVEDIEVNHATKSAKVSIFADAKAEISNNMQVDGVPTGYTLAPGSTVRTANWEVGTVKSDGAWSWA